MTEPRAISANELRDRLLDHMRYLVEYWAEADLGPHATVQSRISGFGHSVLAMLDGCTLNLPAFDLVAQPHEDDEQYSIDSGENWIEDER